MSQSTGSGIYLASDPDQMKQGYYKVAKTANITSTINTLNAARANRDWKLIKFFPCTDVKKLEEFVKSALKKKYISNSTEWIKLEDEASVTKIVAKLETLADITNDSD